MKIFDLNRHAIMLLTRAGIDTAALDTTVLMQKALSRSREYLIAHSDDDVPFAEERKFWQMIERRTNREPVAHITGSREFFGRKLKVTSDVLSPRPETELIIETAMELYPESPEIKVLDLGTGSGCIILTLLAEWPKSYGIGVDISKSALAIAVENAYNLGVANVEFVESDWCLNLPSKQFNLIVSNPPYIPKPEESNLEAELGFEPEGALYAGEDGLDCYRKLAEEISELQFDFAIFEIGIGQHDEIKKIFDEHQMQLKETKKDLAGIERVMIFIKK